MPAGQAFPADPLPAQPAPARSHAKRAPAADDQARARAGRARIEARAAPTWAGAVPARERLPGSSGAAHSAQFLQRHAQEAG